MNTAEIVALAGIFGGVVGYGLMTVAAGARSISRHLRRRKASRGNGIYIGQHYNTRTDGLNLGEIIDNTRTGGDR